MYVRAIRLCFKCAGRRLEGAVRYSRKGTSKRALLITWQVNGGKPIQTARRDKTLDVAAETLRFIPATDTASGTILLCC